MQAYVVGGAVRDELLGRSGADRDWVVVGATPEEMSAAGYRPVGRDFPVFLHPVTHEEYALARTERKSGRGYRGFTVYASPDVTLEDDLRRRDLTINAMARGASGELIDPYGGERDLRAGLLRHVSDAFAEDPVRILRVARFAARFDFRVVPETMALMKSMVDSGEAGFLVPERVWQEFSRGISEAHLVRMFDVLRECGYLERHMAELQPDAAALERAASAGAALAVRFALLAWPMAASGEEKLLALCDRIRVPNESRELALATLRCRALLEGAAGSSPAQLLAALKCADAFRRPGRFGEILLTARLARDDAGMALCTDRLASALAAAQAVDGGAIARAARKPADIPVALDRSREQAIAARIGTGPMQR